LQFGPSTPKSCAAEATLGRHATRAGLAESGAHDDRGPHLAGDVALDHVKHHARGTMTIARSMGSGSSAALATVAMPRTADLLGFTGITGPWKPRGKLPETNGAKAGR
jgi:hypothetical protein